MGLHPSCACSRASLSELERLLAGLEEKPDVYLLFRNMTDEDDGGPAAESALWDSAKSIPGVKSIEDPSGVIALTFGLATSGDIAAYNADAALVFHGGITPSRGHEGDSFGRRRLSMILRGEKADKADSPVFGCGLHDPSDKIRTDKAFHMDTALPGRTNPVAAWSTGEEPHP